MVILNSGRNRAAPHIKSYIRCTKEGVDWALQTSANLSKQAWGEAVNASGELRISSWEIGVLVWPALWGEGATMKPIFRRDSLPFDEAAKKTGPVIALRMPYSFPLQRYGANEKPWVATASYTEPDWKGQVW